MKNINSAVWYKKEDVKIKQKGLLSLVSTTVNHTNRLKPFNNRCVWPSYLSSETFGAGSSIKSWKI